MGCRTVAQGKLILLRTPNSVFYIISCYLCSISLKLHYLKCVKSKWCHCFYSLSSWMSPHLLLLNSISVTLSWLARQHCKTIRLAFQLKSLQLSSQPGFAALVRKALAIAWHWIPRQMWLPPLEGCAGEKSKSVFVQVLIQVRALWVFLIFLPYKKFHRFIHLCSTNFCLVSEVTREIKVSNKGGRQSTEMQLKYQKGGAGQTDLPVWNCTLC